MEELFVQESAIATEKGKNDNSASEVQKTGGVKNIEKSKNRGQERVVYSHEEAVEESIQYFKGDELAARVWANKYALKDSFGNLYEKSPDDMHRRLAREIHRVEMKYKNPLSEELIYNVLKDFRYIVPQGGPMTGIGNDYQIASLSNCFVIGNDGSSDSYGGIMKIDQEQVQLMKRRGGVGHDLSHIRPKGTPEVWFLSWKDIPTQHAKLPRMADEVRLCFLSQSNTPIQGNSSMPSLRVGKLPGLMSR